MDRDTDFDTTVLTDDYGDFQDTVVDQVIAFDPSLFQAPSAQASESASRPAGSSDEDTWVLGQQPQPAARGSAGYAPAQPAPAPTRPVAQAPAPASRASAQQRPSSWQQPPRTTPAMMAATDSAPSKTSPVFVGAIIGLAIVGVVAIAVAIALAFAPQESSRSISSAPAIAPIQVGSSSSALSDGAVAPEPEPEPEPEIEASKQATKTHGTGTRSSTIVGDTGGFEAAEDEFYDELSGFYRKAGDFDGDIRSAASDFNENFLKEDQAVRSAKAGAASSLKSRVKSSWDSLKRLDAPFRSPNTQAYLDMLELYECLYHRIDAIDQAWKIDLQYEKPAEHEAEIVAPLRAQQSGGNDRYYTRFQDLYPQVDLVKP